MLSCLRDEGYARLNRSIFDDLAVETAGGKKLEPLGSLEIRTALSRCIQSRSCERTSRRVVPREESLLLLLLLLGGLLLGSLLRSGFLLLLGHSPSS